MNLDLQPTLRGEHVTVRPMRAEDHDPLFAVAQDKELWAQHPAHDRWQPEVFDRLFAAGLASGGGMTIEDAEGTVIGSSRFYDVTDDEAFIGYTFISRSHWGDGTNAEVKRLMIDHVHASGRTAKFHVGRVNKRSQAAMRKIGGVLVRDGLPAEPDTLAYEIRRR